MVDYNYTFVAGEDPFVDIDPDVLLDAISNMDASFDIWGLISMVVKFSICLTSVASMILLLMTFLKFQHLRRGSNIYLLHYCIWSITDLIFVPTFELIREILLSHTIDFHFTWICAVYQLNTANAALNNYLITALAVDWFLVTTKKIVEKYHQFQKNLLIAIYVTTGIAVITFTAECISISTSLSIHLAVISYCLMVVIILALNFLSLGNVDTGSKYPLIVATGVMLCWLPLLFAYFVYMMDLLHSDSWWLLLSVVNVISEFCAYGAPTLVVYLLAFYNKKFLSAFKKVLSCPSSTQSEENLDEVSLERGNNLDQPTYISANNSPDHYI